MSTEWIMRDSPTEQGPLRFLDLPPLATRADLTCVGNWAVCYDPRGQRPPMPGRAARPGPDIYNLGSYPALAKHWLWRLQPRAPDPLPQRREAT